MRTPHTLSVAETRIGKGIVTTRSFAPGETLFSVTGEFVSGDVEDALDTRSRSNLFRFDIDRYVSPAGSIGDFLNHSCEPNAKVVKRRGKLSVVAIVRIPKGREVCIDYSTITAMDDVWRMRCRCGAKSCRKVVRAFHTLPEQTRTRYREKGIVPKYILAINRTLTEASE